MQSGLSKQWNPGHADRPAFPLPGHEFQRFRPSEGRVVVPSHQHLCGRSSPRPKSHAALTAVKVRRGPLQPVPRGLLLPYPQVRIELLDAHAYLDD